MSDTNWYVITGAPSSGKTTLVKELERRGYRVVDEVARGLIEEGMGRHLTLEEIRSDKGDFQNLVLRTKVEIEKGLPRDEVIIFDRAIPDSIAYFEVACLDPTLAVSKSPRDHYRKVFMLDRVPFQKDQARAEDQGTAARLDQSLEAGYRQRGYEVTRIGVMPVKERLRLLIEEIEKDRMSE
jgi:predicted ATPase